MQISFWKLQSTQMDTIWNIFTSLKDFSIPFSQCTFHIIRWGILLQIFEFDESSLAYKLKILMPLGIAAHNGLGIVTS